MSHLPLQMMMAVYILREKWLASRNTKIKYLMQQNPRVTNKHMNKNVWQNNKQKDNILGSIQSTSIHREKGMQLLHRCFTVTEILLVRCQLLTI